MFFKFPYTDLYTLNLDWMIKYLEETKASLEEWQEIVDGLGSIVHSVNGQSGDVQLGTLVNSVNGQTGAVQLGTIVNSVNGKTGAVEIDNDDINELGIEVVLQTTDAAETFTPAVVRPLFSSGIRFIIINDKEFYSITAEGSMTRFDPLKDQNIITAQNHAPTQAEAETYFNRGIRFVQSTVSDVKRLWAIEKIGSNILAYDLNETNGANIFNEIDASESIEDYSQPTLQEIYKSGQRILFQDTANGIRKFYALLGNEVDGYTGYIEYDPVNYFDTQFIPTLQNDINTLKNADNNTDAKINILHESLNFDYDDIYDLQPSGGTGPGAIGIKREGNFFTLNNPASTSAALVKIKISGAMMRSNTNSVIDAWTGIVLKNGHVYRVTNIHLSGECNVSDGDIISVYKEGTHGSIGIGTRESDRYTRYFKYDGTPVSLVWVVNAGTQYLNYKTCVILEDITEQEAIHGNTIFYNGAELNVQHKLTAIPYMTISTEVSNSPQGAACYNNFLFVAYTTLPMISIYNLEDQTHIANIIFTPNSNYHCNVLNFGPYKFDDADEFPLLYVSMENINEHKCLVYRIQNANNVYTATLIQTIVFPAPSTESPYYPNAYIDTINKKLYIMGYIKQSFTSDEDRVIRIMGYNLPKIDTASVTLNTADAFKDFTVIPPKTSIQGGFLNGDYLIYPMGNPSALADIYILQISLSAEKYVTQIKLNELGITVEPESIFMYNGQLYMLMANRIIYMMIS